MDSVAFTSRWNTTQSSVSSARVCWGPPPCTTATRRWPVTCPVGATAATARAPASPAAMPPVTHHRRSQAADRAMPPATTRATVRYEPGQPGGLAHGSVGLAHGQRGQRLAPEREAPSGHLGQGEQGRQGQPSGSTGRAEGGRHPEVGGEDGAGQHVARRGEVPHPEQAHRQPGEGHQPGAPEPPLPPMAGDQSVEQGDADEGQGPPSPGRQGGGDAQPGQHGPTGDPPARRGGLEAGAAGSEADRAGSAPASGAVAVAMASILPDGPTPSRARLASSAFSPRPARAAASAVVEQRGCRRSGPTPVSGGICGGGATWLPPVDCQGRSGGVGQGHGEHVAVGLGAVGQAGAEPSRGRRAGRRHRPGAAWPRSARWTGRVGGRRTGWRCGLGSEPRCRPRWPARSPRPGSHRWWPPRPPRTARGRRAGAAPGGGRAR